MSIQRWSEEIILAELLDDPVFTDDLVTLIEDVEKNSGLDVLLNFSQVNFLNSSNLAKLLRLRKAVSVTNGRKLILCSVNTHVWGLFLTTGLNKTFDFADDVSLGLTSLQIDRPLPQGDAN